MLSLEQPYASNLNLNLKTHREDRPLNDFNIAQLQLQYQTQTQTQTQPALPAYPPSRSRSSSLLAEDFDSGAHSLRLISPLAPGFTFFDTSAASPGGLLTHSMLGVAPDEALDAMDKLTDTMVSGLDGLDNLDMDYENRRMSTSAASGISCTSAQSAHSAQSARTNTTAATSTSAYSNAGLKRAPSPGALDEFDYSQEYDPYREREDGNERDGSPRTKRARPTLSLEPATARSDSDSPLPSGVPTTTTSSGAGDGAGRVRLPSLYSALDATSSMSAPPTSHGPAQGFAHPQQYAHSAQNSQHQLFGQGQGQSQSQNQGAFTFSTPSPQSNAALDLRRGSLPSLYSNSLAARGGQRLLNQYAGTQGGMRSSAFNFSMGSGTGDSTGLAGYQFPAPAGSSNNGSGSNSTPTPTAGSPYGGTPTSSLGSAQSTGFPPTPLDYQQQQSQGQQQHQHQKDFANLTKEYLGGNSGDEWGSIVRPASTPSSGSTTTTPASASASSPFSYGANLGGGVGGLPLPRISGYAHQKPTDQEWYTPSGSFVQPSPGSSGGSNAQNQSHHPQTAPLSPGPRPSHMHVHLPSSGSSSAAVAAAAAAAATLNVSPAAAASAASVAAQVAARPARRRGKLPKPTTDFLKDWLHRHSDHPYPSEEEKKQLCHATGLSMSQVSNWMINARRRILAPANRSAQGPTTTVPSFPSGTSAGLAPANRAQLGLAPHHGLPPAHGAHHSLSPAHGLSHPYSSVGLGVSGMGGFPQSGNTQLQLVNANAHQHQLHAAQGSYPQSLLGSGTGGSGLYHSPQHQHHQQQQQQQQQQHHMGMSHASQMGNSMYDLALQRRASMPALALNSSSLGHAHSHAPQSAGSGLQLYVPHAPSTRSSLSGLPSMGGGGGGGYSHQQQQHQHYSPHIQSQGQGQLHASPTPQRGYVFPPPGSSGSGTGGEDGQ
ncbi:hypothetical protein M0805_008520 [Coniferiporia weirii]|nr:hypothetical protein M0805_008520 [Coniferiporia weirii]